MAPSSTSIAQDKYTELARSDNDGLVQGVTYTPAVDGTYSIDVNADGMHGVRYQLTIAGSAEKPRFRTRCFLHGPSIVRRGTKVRLRAGVVDPDLSAIPGKAIKLYSSRNGRTWTQCGTVQSTTSVSVLRIKITRKTYFRLRFGGDSTYKGSASRILTVKVR